MSIFYSRICIFLILFVVTEGREKQSKSNSDSFIFKYNNGLHSSHSLKARFIRNQISSESTPKQRSHKTVSVDGIHMDRAVGLSRSDIVKEKKSPYGNHEVIFAVQPKNQEQLKNILDSVSDPRNVLYGRHWTREQVADLTSNPEGTATVLSFLAAAGATVVSESLYGEYITASAPIALWEDLFDTTFHVFTHIRRDGSRKKVVRAEKYSIPATLIPHVVAVFNTVQLPMRSRQPLISPLNKTLNKTESRAVPVIRHFTIPSILNAAYKIDSNVASVAATQGLYESLDQSFSPADLQKFQSRHSYPDQPVIRVIGEHSSDRACTSNPNDCAEANLDVQYMMAISNSPTTYWYSDQNNFSDWLISVSNDPKPPLVLST